MTRARPIIGAMWVLAALASVLYLAFRGLLAHRLAVSSEHQTSSSAPTLSLTPAAERGHRLAQTYCQSCHLFPEPALLDKATWEQGALPDMAPWLGLVRPKLERRRDGEIITEADVFPPSPLISPEDWEAIRNYYKQAAPEKPLPQPDRPPIQPN